MKIVQKAQIPLFLVFTGFSFFTGYQLSNTEGVSIGADNTPPHASAMLDVFSSNKGVLVPRVTETQRENDILNPANGLLVFTEDSNEEKRGFYYHDNIAAEWKKVGGGFKIPLMTYAQMRALPRTSDHIGKIVYVTTLTVVTNAIYPFGGNVCEREANVHGLWYLGYTPSQTCTIIEWHRMQHDFGTPTGTSTSNCGAFC
ncbi:MAG: hypothetical protein M3Q58_12420 [Bacteroidota bacterium]|nr:hypothetical protein [Bacteroidota bacterium]